MTKARPENTTTSAQAGSGELPARPSRDTDLAFNNGLRAALVMLEQELGGLPADSLEATLAQLRLGHYRHRIGQLFRRGDAERQAERDAAFRRAI
jgi:hypothetical protein